MGGISLDSFPILTTEAITFSSQVETNWKSAFGCLSSFLNECINVKKIEIGKI